MDKLVPCCMCGLGMLLVAGACSAQSGPAKHIEIVVPVAKGGGTDATARLVQKMLGGQRSSFGFAVVNLPGKGGAEAWAYLASFEGSGRHFAISTPQLLTNYIIGADPRTYLHFTPLTNLYNEYVLLAVRSGSPLVNGRALAARLRDGSSPVSVAVAPALGSHNHIAVALIARAAGGDPRNLRVTVFNTGADAAIAVLGGKADLVASTAGTLLDDVQSGRLHPLGLTAPMRLGGPLAAVPTLKEQGVEVMLPSWRGVVGPKGMAPSQIAYWEHTFAELSLSHDWLAEMTRHSWAGAYLDSNETRTFLDAQYALFRRALSDVGLTR